MSEQSLNTYTSKKCGKQSSFGSQGKKSMEIMFDDDGRSSMLSLY